MRATEDKAVPMRTPEQSRAIYRDLTTAAFGERIGGVSATHVRELIEAGEIPEAIDVALPGKRHDWRIPESAVERFRTERSAAMRLQKAG